MRLWTAANTVSGAGTWMQMVAQNLLVLQLTDSVAMTGLSLSAQAAPGLLFGVLGGAVADRYPRRLVVMTGQLALAGVAFATAALAAADLLTVALVMALGVLSGIVATADGPAATLLGNELVPREDVSSAIAVGSVASNAGRLAGTALAGLTVATLGISAAYVANGISFLLVAACVPFLRRAATAAAGGQPAQVIAPSTSSEGSLDGGVGAGLRYLVKDSVLLTLLVVGLVTSMLGRNFTLTMAALVTGPLDGSAADYGRVGTALAIGGVLGGVLAGRLCRPGLGMVVALAGMTAGLQAIVGLSPGVLAVLLVAVPMAAVEGAMVTAVDTMVQTRPLEQFRGRVLGAWRTAATAWGLAGPIVLGAMLQLLGARAGLVVGGLLIVVALVAVRIATRSVPVRASIAFAT
jgi:MFS family permease